MEIALIYAGMNAIGPVPYGLTVLAAILEKEGHKVSILDFDGDPLSCQSFEKRMSDRRPKMIGITLMTTPMLERAAELLSYARRLFPTATIVAGGPHATIFPAEILRELPVDIVAVGEADITIKEIARTIELDGNLGSVAGICFKKDGDVVNTGPGPMLSRQEMDMLPVPAWHLVDIYKHYYVYIIESYGCPFKCTFCYTHMHGNYRSKSPSRIVEDIAVLANKYKVRMFKFWDDLPFGGSKQKMREFCRLLIDRNLDVKWTCFLRPEGVDDETIDIMVKSGCFRIAMGVESGSPRMLQLLNKENTPEKYIEAFRILGKYDIITAVPFMLGLPGESRSDIQLSIGLAEKIKATEYYSSNYKPYPGTKLYQAALDRGFKPPGNIIEWSRYSDFSNYSRHSSELTTEELLQAKKHIENLTDNWKKYRILLKAGWHQFKASPFREARKFLKIARSRVFK
ncbi:MAG TPA: hypothetical protein DET40_01200 [Lentisphaeria bacterium]|nr:MAG: hypothetical protein A2X45_12680 [Lentisphaerae bacterium GWF2_50_93]HCE42148.1 hypothetical protein [Lentisphaeria bacterium]